MTRQPYVETADDREAARSAAWWLTPGLYAGRMRRRGPEVAVKISHEPTRDPDIGELLDRSWYWNVWVDGKHLHVAEFAPPDGLSHDWMPWRLTRQIEQWEYDFLIQNANWARAHRPESPEANPRAPVDLTKLGPIF